MPQIYGKGGHYKPETTVKTPSPVEDVISPEGYREEPQAEMKGQATEPLVPSQLDPTPPRDENTPASAMALDRVTSVLEFVVASLYERGGISKEEFDMLSGVLSVGATGEIGQ